MDMSLERTIIVGLAAFAGAVLAGGAHLNHVGITPVSLLMVPWIGAIASAGVTWFLTPE